MFVVAKKDQAYQYDQWGHIHFYGLVAGQIYQIAKEEDISPGPNNSDFIHIYQIDSKAIPHLPQDFYSLEEWRQLQIESLEIQ